MTQSNIDLDALHTMWLDSGDDGDGDDGTRWRNVIIRQQR